MDASGEPERANKREPSYVVPDFAADKQQRERYDAIAKSIITTAVNQAVAEVSRTFAIKARELQIAASVAETTLAKAEHEAHVARVKYARLVPKQRTASGIVRPPKFLFEGLFTMGAANAYYEVALATQLKKAEATHAARTAAAELARIPGQQEAEIVKSELAIRREFKTERGRAELDADQRLQDLAASCAAIDEERLDFKQRSELGLVSDEELRDRAMAEHGHRYLDGSVRGLHCLRERDARFGRLRYFTFRDREGRIWLLDFHEDLFPLTHIDFDTTLVDGRYSVARSATDDTRLTASASRGAHDGHDPRTGLASTARFSARYANSSRVKHRRFGAKTALRRQGGLQMKKLTLTAVIALGAFAAGVMAGHFSAPAGAASAPLVPQLIGLAALTPDDLPAPANGGTTRSKVLVNTDGMTLGVQIGPTARHYHADANEIQYVVAGTGTEWLGDNVVALKPGDLLIIPKGTPHGGLTDHVKLIAIKTPPQAADDTHPIR